MTGPKYKTPDEFLKVANDYFQHCADKGKKTTQAGLCVFADLNTKMAFNDLKERKDVEGSSITWKDLVSRIRLMLEDAAWQRGQTIDIFYLKNYHGMTDKQDITTNGEGLEINIVIGKQKRGRGRPRNEN